MSKNSLVQDFQTINAIEFDIEDEANPRSVVNLTAGAPTFHRALKDLLMSTPELLEMEFDEIRQKANPTFTLSRLRLGFWNEYENAIQHNRQMQVSKCFAGICTETVWKKKVISDRVKLAYILSPPKDYAITVKEALDAGLDNLRAIVTAKVVSDDGTLNAKAADIVLKAIALLDMRVKGAVVQRIDQRSLNVNVNRDVTPTPETQVPKSLEELDRQLAQIKQKLIKDISQAKLPASPQEIVDTMKELNVELIDVGGSYKLKNEQ